MTRTLSALVLAVGLVASPLAAAPAHAQGVLDPALEYALAASPGGVVVSDTSAVWPEIGMRLDVLDPTSAVAARAVGDCATGAICAYSAAGQAGVKLSWSTCGSKSTAALASVGSIANARSGVLSARQGTTVRASTRSNSYANVPVSYRSSITNVFC